MRAGIPAGDELGDRARDTLFTRTPLDRVREVAPLLPTDVLTSYCQRSLSRIQRRGKRIDRAELALELLAISPEEVRRACSEELRECLTEDAIDLRFGAARALAQDPEGLRAEDRSAIAEVYSGLPAEWQERLAPYLTHVLPDDVVLDVAALNRWLLGAKDDEIFDRLQAGLERWKKTAAIDAPGVAALSSTLLALAEKLPQQEREVARSAIAEQVSDWLAKARADTRNAISTLLEGGGVADLISEYFWKSSLSRLAPTLVSVLLPAAIDASSIPEETLGRLASEVPGAHEGFRSALSALIAEGFDLDQVFELAGPSGQRELLLARLRVTRTLAADERRLAAARDEATTEALVASRETVLSALEAADEASAGNERLQRHFAAIRRAIGFVTESPIAAPPGQAVLEWRTHAADRVRRGRDCDGSRPADNRHGGRAGSSSRSTPIDRRTRPTEPCTRGDYSRRIVSITWLTSRAWFEEYSSGATTRCLRRLLSSRLVALSSPASSGLLHLEPLETRERR